MPRLEFPVLQFIANTKTQSMFLLCNICNEDLSLFKAKKIIVLHTEAVWFVLWSQTSLASDPSSATYCAVIVNP